MALNGDGIGATVAGIFKAMRPTPGTPVTDTHLEDTWKAVMNAIYADIKASAEVLPNTFAASPGIAVAVSTSTGIGATTAPGPLTGEGKVS